MNKRILLLLLLFSSISLSAGAQIVGSWEGDIKLAPQYALKLVIHIAEAEDGALEAKLDSPDQGGYGIPASLITFDQEIQKLTFEIQSLNARYEGTLEGDTIKGHFVQRAMPFVLNLTRAKAQEEVIYPYDAEEVKIINPEAEGVTLAGTLTTPKELGHHPAVLLVAGSGGLDRNSTLLGHQPLFDLADYLTRQGVMVLRYDKRGIAESTGDFAVANTYDFASDARAALSYLRSHPNASKVGIIGHSEGGLIAQMIAAENPELVDFIVLLAAPAISGLETVVFQNNQQMGAFLESGKEAKFEQLIRNTFSELMAPNNSRVQDSTIYVAFEEELWKLVAEDKKPILKDYFEDRERISLTLDQLRSPFYTAFLRIDPADYLPRIKCPVLALNGEKDRQVGVEVNLETIKRLTTQSSQLVVKSYPDLNHLFIPSVTGSPQEYPMLKGPFSIEVLSDIYTFISSFQ